MRGEVDIFLGDLQRDGEAAGYRLAHLEHFAPRPAAYGEVAPPLPACLIRALAAQGIGRLYAHQARALALARAGRDLVVATPTASGKSLAYLLPVLERLLAEPAARALFVFPLKALEQDQLKAINQLAFAAGLPPLAAVYDGDTPPAARKKLKENRRPS